MVKYGPSPDAVAREEMDASGIPDDVVLARAVMLGAVFKDYGPETDLWGQTARYIIHIPGDFKQPSKDQNIVGFVGGNEYTLAWRWLRSCYPDALKACA